MRHLDMDSILAVEGGLGKTSDRLHLAECESCRREVETWRLRLADLQDLEANAVDKDETHKLRVIFREFGPAPAEVRWIARLASRSVLVPETVRGALTSTFKAYRAGPFELVLQTRPMDVKGRYELLGQMTGNDDVTPEGNVVLTSENGHLGRTLLDQFGEFRFTDVPEGHCRLMWCVSGGRVDLESLMIGEQDAEKRD